MWILNQNKDYITNGKIMYYIEKINYYDKPDIPLYPENGYYIYIDNSTWRLPLGYYESEDKAKEVFQNIVETILNDIDASNIKYFEMPSNE